MANAKHKYLFLMAEVDVPTGEKPEKREDPKPTRRVGPGLLSKLGLSEKEIDSLPRGIVRKATADEIEAADTADAGANDAETRAEIEQVKAEQEREMASLQGKLSAERSEAEAAGKLSTAEKREKYDAAQAKQVDALAAKHAKALKALEG